MDLASWIQVAAVLVALFIHFWKVSESNGKVLGKLEVYEKAILENRAYFERQMSNMQTQFNLQNTMLKEEISNVVDRLNSHLEKQ